MRRARLTMLLLFFAVPVVAQPRTSESIEVSIVNVDVVVTDRQGNRVKGLTAEDFEIRESGKVQPITNFAEYGSMAAEGKTGLERARAAQAAPRPPRTIVVFVEWMRMPPFEAERMYGGLRTMLRNALGPDDRAMIATWSTKVTEVQRKSQPFRIPRSELDQAKGSHFTYEVAVKLDAKVDRLSIGVVDETAKEVGLKRIAIPARPTATATKR